MTNYLLIYDHTTRVSLRIISAALVLYVRTLHKISFTVRRSTMYTPGKGGSIPAVVAGATLPVTGPTGNVIVTVAVALVAALVAWGIGYAVTHRSR